MERFSLLGPAKPVPRTILYPAIDPLPRSPDRPFWSVMIPTRNRIEYLQQALQSVLDQNIAAGEMQIEVIDNGSTEGNPEMVLRKVGKDRVSFFRQPESVEMGTNWTTCIRRARGYWIHILHDDDMVMPGFYAAYRQFIECHPGLVMVFSRSIAVDENGHWLNIMSPLCRKFSGLVEDAGCELVKRNFIPAPTVAVAREAYVKVGGFAPVFGYCADWEMWMRVARCGLVGYIDQPYSLYRVHAGSDTDRLAKSGRNIDEILQAIEVGLNRLPVQACEAVRVDALRHCSTYAVDIRRRLHQSGEHRAALWHAFVAFKLHRSRSNLLRLVKSFGLAVGLSWKRRDRSNGGRRGGVS